MLLEGSTTIPVWPWGGGGGEDNAGLGPRILKSRCYGVPDSSRHISLTNTDIEGASRIQAATGQARGMDSNATHTRGGTGLAGCGECWNVERQTSSPTVAVVVDDAGAAFLGKAERWAIWG